MADKPKNLDARIDKALAVNGEADHNTLVELWNEAADQIDAAQAVIDAETPRLLDLSTDNPDKSQELIESSKLRIERLTKAINEELRPRVEALDREAAITQWSPVCFGRIVWPSAGGSRLSLCACRSNRSGDLPRTSKPKSTIAPSEDTASASP